METLIVLGLPGVIGGFVLALLIMKLGRRRHGETSPDAFRNEPLSTDVINMSRIRVAGIGGLGLVAMALTVAFNVPRIGQTLSAGLVLGAIFAAVLIVRRRRQGPMPSSGRSIGANTTLSIDAPAATPDDKGASDVRMQNVAPVAPAALR